MHDTHMFHTVYDAILNIRFSTGENLFKALEQQKIAYAVHAVYTYPKYHYYRNIH